MRQREREREREREIERERERESIKEIILKSPEAVVAKKISL